MKRFIALLLALILAVAMVFSLCACAQKTYRKKSSHKKDDVQTSQDDNQGEVQGDNQGDNQDDNQDNSQGNTPSDSQSGSQNQDNGNMNNGQANRDISGRSDLYRQSYNYMTNNMDKIIALYYEDQTTSLINSLKGTLEDTYEAVNKFDPEFFEKASQAVADNYTDNALEHGLVKSGLDAYFSDSAIGKGLRDISEAFFLGLLEKSLRTDENRRYDMLRVCAVNTEYMVARTDGTVNNLIGQISRDSGYQTATNAIQKCYDEIYNYYNQNITQEMNIYMNNKEGADEISDKWDILQGRMDALQDAKKAWDDNLESWVHQFLDDLALGDDTPLAAYVYCIYDKDSKLQGVFWESSDITEIKITEQGICSWKSKDGSFHAINGSGQPMYGDLSTGKYFNPAPCGNLLHAVEMDDFDNGSYYKLELVSPDGKTKELLSGYDINAHAYGYDPNHYLGYTRGHAMRWFWNSDNQASDLWQVDYRTLEKQYSSVMVDMASGEVTPINDYLTAHPEVKPADSTRINAKYKLDTSTWELVEVSDDPDAEKKVAADFSAGQGLERLFYDNLHDRYWAITQSGYYYVTDGKFKRLHDPIKLPHGWVDVTPYGILAQADVPDSKTTVYGLFDPEGNMLFTAPGKDIKGFIGDIYNNPVGARVSTNGCFNLITGQQMYILA